jgi:hypothetical protein
VAPSERAGTGALLSGGAGVWPLGVGVADTVGGSAGGATGIFVGRFARRPRRAVVASTRRLAPAGFRVCFFGFLVVGFFAMEPRAGEFDTAPVRPGRTTQACRRRRTPETCYCSHARAIVQQRVPSRMTRSRRSTSARQQRRPATQAAKAVVPPPSGTLGSWLHHLGAELDATWLPVWPPDAFGIAAAFLRRTGAYAGMVNGLHIEGSDLAKGRPFGAVGREWRETLTDVLTGGGQARLRDACPSEVKRWWGVFHRHAHLPLIDAAAEPDVAVAACALAVAADEASVDIGVRLDPEDAFLGMAAALQQHHDFRSFCWRIPPESLAVLPKQHTPQVGCTIRSLTHNLALCTASEIHARWHGPYRPADGALDVLNLLLLPWPVEVRASDFTLAGTRRGGEAGSDAPSAARYFDYAPRESPSPAAMAQRVRLALTEARTHAARIHGIVLPELSLDAAQFAAVERLATQEGAFLVSGVRGMGGSSAGHMPLNSCAIQLGGLAMHSAQVQLGRSGAGRDRVRTSTRLVQHKHHRWCLNRDQILQYSLGGRLPASRDCWERIYVPPREVNFVTVGEWLTMCVLICEDLARQDPVAEVIRSVGPNVVFALLMDGPQLRERWSARYASVLAEDPGSSVLTMTSLGMSRRSRREAADAGPDRSATIALWRDAIFGAREISLGPGHDACVLSLVRRTGVEKTIDGRVDERRAHYPVFAGVHPFATPAAAPVRGARRRGRAL